MKRLLVGLKVFQTTFITTVTRESFLKLIIFFSFLFSWSAFAEKHSWHYKCGFLKSDYIATFSKYGCNVGVIKEGCTDNRLTCSYRSNCYEPTGSTCDGDDELVQTQGFVFCKPSSQEMRYKHGVKGSTYTFMFEKLKEAGCEFPIFEQICGVQEGVGDYGLELDFETKNCLFVGGKSSRCEGSLERYKSWCLPKAINRALQQGLINNPGAALE